MECLESGVFRSDIPCSFALEPSAFEVCCFHLNMLYNLQFSYVLMFFLPILVFFFAKEGKTRVCQEGGSRIKFLSPPKKRKKFIYEMLLLCNTFL